MTTAFARRIREALPGDEMVPTRTDPEAILLAVRVLKWRSPYRHNPQTKRAKQLIEDGAIGELRLIRSALSFSLHDE